MKVTPSSTARRRTLSALSRSGGQPHIPSPVRRIAPKPRRFTERSPPKRNEDLPAGLVAAVTSFCNSTVKRLTPPARVTPKNFRRFIAQKLRLLLSTLNSQLSPPDRRRLLRIGDALTAASTLSTSPPTRTKWP